MKHELFISQFERLEKLFLKQLTADQLKAFYHELNAIDDTEFMKSCHRIVKEERFFPSISCFLKDIHYQPGEYITEICPECKTDKTRSGMLYDRMRTWRCENGHEWKVKEKLVSVR